MPEDSSNRIQKDFISNEGLEAHLSLFHGISERLKKYLTVLLMTQLNPKTLAVLQQCVLRKSHTNQKNAFILPLNINPRPLA